MLNRMISISLTGIIVFLWFLYDFLQSQKWSLDFSHFHIPFIKLHVPLFLEPITVVNMPLWAGTVFIWWLIDWGVVTIRRDNDFSFATRSAVFLGLLVLTIIELLNLTPSWTTI